MRAGRDGRDERDERRDGGREKISALEWGVAALGLLLVLGALALVVGDSLRAGPEGPVVRVQADSVVALAGGRWRVHFTAHNAGRGTAAELTITGELRDGAGTVTSQATLDYLPGRSRRHGGLFFARDPRAGSLELRAEGYREP